MLVEYILARNSSRESSTDKNVSLKLGSDVFNGIFGIVFLTAGEEVNCKVVVFWPVRREG